MSEERGQCSDEKPSGPDNKSPELSPLAFVYFEEDGIRNVTASFYKYFFRKYIDVS